MQSKLNEFERNTDGIQWKDHQIVNRFRNKDGETV